MNECHTTGPQKKFIGLPWTWKNSLSLRFPKPLLCFWPSLAGRDLAGSRAGHLGWGGGSPGRSLLANCPPTTGRRAGRCPRSPHTSVPRDGLEILTLSFYFSHLGNVRRGHSRNNCAPTDTTHTQNPPASAARGPRRRASRASRASRRPPIRPPHNDVVVSPKHPSPHRWRPARCTDTAGHLSAASAAARAVNSAHRVVSSGARCGGSTLFRVLTLACNDFSRCGTRGHRFRAHTPAPWLHQDGVRTPPPFDSGTFSLPPRDQSPHRQLPRAPATTARCLSKGPDAVSPFVWSHSRGRTSSTASTSQRVPGSVPFPG